MSTPLRILILEDRPTDAYLVVLALRDAGFDFEWTRVQDESGFLDELDPPPDLICSDYYMPQFDAMQALTLLQERQLDIPFIVVSGSIGEDLAVAAMRQGASDYLFKDKLARLGLAVQQALEQKRLREDKRRSEESLRRFLAMLAHELRNPMAPLLTSLEVVRRSGRDDEVRERALGTLARSVRQLARLVDDLLEAIRVTQGTIQVHPERLDLARLVRTTLEDHRATVEKAGLTLTIRTPETPLWIQGDATRLTQVFGNLLDNAIKFTDAGGQVEVSLASDANNRAVAVIRDTGQGIEASLLPHLFTVFSQGTQGLDRHRGGLGLGLAIVKRLVELHQGEIQASSEGPGRGSVFTLRLPLEPEPAALTALPSQHRTGPSRRILVVEDNRDAADSLRLLLEAVGYEARVAYTGLEGVKAATEWGPDVVLSDIGLPGLDGLGLARELRRHPATGKTRLIAVTGYGSDEDRQLSRQAGFEAHLVKPVDPEELQRLLWKGE